MKAQVGAIRTLPAVVALLVFGAACGSGTAPDHERARPLAVATFSIIGDLLEAVGGEYVDAHTLVPLGGDPHSYEPVPSDARLIADADVVFDNGLGLSPWFETLREHARGRVVVLTEELRHEAVRAHDGEIDPHMWLAPPFAARYVDVIAQTLTEIDPQNRERYAENAQAYREELEALDEELRTWVETIPEEARKLVTYEDAFNYFGAHYGLEILATAVGPTTEEEPSAERIRTLVDRVRDAEIPAIFVEELVDARVIERAAADAGVELAGQALFIDSLGEEGSGAETYIDMMRLNLRTIVIALGGEVEGS